MGAGSFLRLKLTAGSFGGLNIRSDRMEQRKNLRDSIAEAESTPLGFLPKERSLYVRSMVDTVNRLWAERKSIEEIQSTVPEFARDYKNLFEMLTKPGGYDKKSLQVMLTMLDQMGTGNLSQHQASVIVGQKLADTYIKPTLQRE